jgi:hypothetical protein
LFSWFYVSLNIWTMWIFVAVLFSSVVSLQWVYYPLRNSCKHS